MCLPGSSVQNLLVSWSSFPGMAAQSPRLLTSADAVLSLLTSSPTEFHKHVRTSSRGFGKWHVVAAAGAQLAHQSGSGSGGWCQRRKVQSWETRTQSRASLRGQSRSVNSRSFRPTGDLEQLLEALFWFFSGLHRSYDGVFRNASESISQHFSILFLGPVRLLSDWLFHLSISDWSQWSYFF